MKFQPKRVWELEFVAFSTEVSRMQRMKDSTAFWVVDFGPWGFEGFRV